MANLPCTCGMCSTYEEGYDAGAASRDAEVEVLRTALERIARWHGEFPAVTNRDGAPSTYEAEYGSNGQRDFMRGVARAALDAAQEGTK